MKYDFTSILDRRGYAWAVDTLNDNPRPPKEGWNVIPMWVADMSFPTCPTIPEARIGARKSSYLRIFQYFTGILELHHRLADKAQRCKRSQEKGYRL